MIVIKGILSWSLIVLAMVPLSVLMILGLVTTLINIRLWTAREH